jgi:hypothetical protein
MTPFSLSNIHLNIIHSPYLLVFLAGSFLLAFPLITYMRPSSPSFMLNVLPISSSPTSFF